MKAIGNNKPDCLTIINKHGGNINHVNVHGESALTRAAKTGTIDPIRVLLQVSLFIAHMSIYGNNH